MKKKLLLLSIVIGLQFSCRSQNIGNKTTENIKNNNPVFEGWYADPEAVIFGNEYWIYPTYSDDFRVPDISKKISEKQKEIQKNTINEQYLKQTFLNAFSSKDLVTWKKHSHVLDIENVSWAAYSVWAPSIIHSNNKYYLFFSANDIQSNSQIGGIGVAVANQPQGPFKDAIGKPLIDSFHNGAQPIDQFIFKDDNGQNYLYYGGWGHCNIVKLSADFLHLEKFDDGQTFKEITPQNYTEGVCVFKRNSKYYLMWSEGDWTGPDYSVSYAIADSPIGPFKRIAKILQQDYKVARGAGHNSVIHIPNSDKWYIVYHRRPLSTDNGNHREVCIDQMYFYENGNIKPVQITFEGIKAAVIVNK